MTRKGDEEALFLVLDLLAPEDAREAEVGPQQKERGADELTDIRGFFRAMDRESETHPRGLDLEELLTEPILVEKRPGFWARLAHLFRR